MIGKRGNEGVKSEGVVGNSAGIKANLPDLPRKKLVQNKDLLETRNKSPVAIDSQDFSTKQRKNPDFSIPKQDYPKQPPDKLPIYKSQSSKVYDKTSSIPQSLNKITSLLCANYPCLDPTTFIELMNKYDTSGMAEILGILDSMCEANEKHEHSHQINRLHLPSFKTEPCSDKENCLNELCSKYHTLAERRRMPIFYSEQICKFRFNCSEGDRCQFAHTYNEMIYHPKTVEFCRSREQKRMNFRGVEREIEKMPFHALKAVHRNMVAKHSGAIKELENVLIENTRMKSKTYCLKCKSCTFSVVKVNCGHFFCKSCNTSMSCAICNQDSPEYQICNI
jgi:hypothetical protein